MVEVEGQVNSDLVRRPYGRLLALYGHDPKAASVIYPAMRHVELDRKDSFLAATDEGRRREWRRSLGALDKALLRPRPASGRIRL